MPRDMTMTFAPIARSLISQKQPVTGVVTLNPVEAFGTINLRLPDEQARLKAGEVLCMSFPAEANTFTADDNRIVIWLGPDEWLLQAPDEEIHELHKALESGLAGQPIALTVVSDHSVALELKGDNARRILEKGCPLDLHPRVFASGHCAQSHFLQAVIILIQRAEGDYLLRVRRSMAEYLWDALADAIAKDS